MRTSRKASDRQTRTSNSHGSTNDDDEYLREASKLNEHDCVERLDDIETRGPERRDV